MTAHPVFNLGRILTLSCVTLFSLAWIVLLSIVAFAWWTLLSVAERSFIGFFIFTNFITVIGLPVLILHDFRPWLDAARMLLFIMAHLGAAIGFAIWVPQFTCSDKASMNTCQSINDYILAFSWANPILLILYTVCLSIFWWRQRSAQPEVPSKLMFLDDGDIEKSGAVPLSDEAISNRMRSLRVPSKVVTPTPLQDQPQHDPAVRPEWDRLPRLATPPTPTKPRPSVPPTPRNTAPRVSLPPLPPHMSWAMPPSPSVYSTFTEFNPYISNSPVQASSPVPSSPALSYYYTSPPRKSSLPPPTRRTTLNVSAAHPTDRVDRLSALVAARFQNDASSDDSHSTAGRSDGNRKLMKSLTRTGAL